MKITVETGALHQQTADALVQFVATEQNDRLERFGATNGTLEALLASGDFNGAEHQLATLYPAQPGPRLLLVGLGNSGNISAATLRKAAARAMRKSRELGVERVALALPDALPAEAAAEAVSEGALLGLYHYQGLKSTPAPEALPRELILVVAAERDLAAASSGARTGEAIAQGACLTRELVNTPANFCTPADLAEAAGSLSGLRVEVLERADMEALGMGALLGVAQGSETPPKFIVMEHNPERSDALDSLVLAGKGVTFDTGGYSLKSLTGMVGMKSDMGGGAAVIGAMQAISALQPELHVVGLVPAVDNLVSAKAIRPQDVLTASNGLTIEIISTDAEGRLILADALVYATRYQPAAVIDIATLTGSCVTALGSAAAGLFSSHGGLRDALLAASGRCGESVWPLPLFPDYDKAIESQAADLKNSAAPLTGVGTSAAFLQRFANYPAWAHLDIAGMVGIEGLGSINREDPLIPEKGATGFGARLFIDLVRNWKALD